MDSGTSHDFRFRSFRLCETERLLLKNGDPVPLTPKAFDVLIHLVKNAGHLVEKEKLIQSVWPDSFVEEGNLTRTIHTLRRALGENDSGNKFIETVPTKGYRFVAAVEDPPETPITRDEASVENAAAPTAKPGGVWTAFLGRPILWIIVTALVAGVSFEILMTIGSKGSAAAMLGPETLNGEAYQHFTQGRLLVERKLRGDDQTALAEFDKAIELDRNYANAYAGRADAKYILFVKSGSHEDVSEARTAVRNAIELDPTNVYALTIDCRILATYDWDRGEAEKECRKAVEIDPQNEGAHRELAFLLSSLGRNAEALQAMDKAVTIAPTSFNKRSRGVLLYLSRDYDAALDQFLQVSRTDPLFTETAWWLLRCYHMKQDQKDAFEVYVLFLERSGASADEIKSVRETFERSGWTEVLRRIADKLGKSSMLPAGIYAQLGEKDEAFEILDNMSERRAIMLVTAAREPMLDPLRDDPRYDAIMAKIGFPDSR